MNDGKFVAAAAAAANTAKMFTPSAIAIVSTANSPLLIRTNLDDIDKEEATKLIYLLHASLDIIDEKSEQPTSRDNFLGVLYQCEQYKIYGLMSTTKVKILLMLSLKMNQGVVPRENDIRQMLKNIHKAYIDATAMNPFYKPHQPVKSKRLDGFLDTIFVTPTPPPPSLPPQIATGDEAHSSLPGNVTSQATATINIGSGSVSPVNPAIQTVWVYKPNPRSWWSKWSHVILNSRLSFKVLEIQMQYKLSNLAATQLCGGRPSSSPDGHSISRGLDLAEEEQSRDSTRQYSCKDLAERDKRRLRSRSRSDIP